MKQILWFRRDLRITDNELLAYAKGEVLPIFIFDTNILDKLDIDDKRVTFIYDTLINLKQELQKIKLDLMIFHGKPKEIFQTLKQEGFTKVLCGVDYDDYSKKRDDEVEKIIPIERFNTAFLLYPNEHLKKNQTPYKVFTPFYKSLQPLWEQKHLPTVGINANLTLSDYTMVIPSLEELGFVRQELPSFLRKTVQELLNSFIPKVENYQIDRDAIYKTGTTQLSVHFRFGLISVKEFFNTIRPYRESQSVIRQLFFREFYNYLLYHFPTTQFENQKSIKVKWRNNQEEFQKWCLGETGVPIIDAAMRYFNQTGVMHNRLRMIVASFLTKNLLIDWRWGEQYFASKLLDYDACTNIASWQWATSTGSDAVPYFRVFNPYTQSEKFDKDGVFIRSVIPELKNIDSKQLHQENGVQNNLFVDYVPMIVSIQNSRQEAIRRFKEANETKVSYESV